MVNLSVLAPARPEAVMHDKGVAVDSFDIGSYYIIDQVVPRTKLPRGTSEFRFTLGAKNTYNKDFFITCYFKISK